MIARHLYPPLIAILAGFGLAACDIDLPWQSKGFASCLADFPVITETIAKDTGYQIDYSDVTGNRRRMQISIYDEKLVAADAATRESAASIVARAAEHALATHAECATIEIISVGIYHPSGLSGPMRAWHLEDVVEFQKGLDQRFVPHVRNELPHRTP